MMTEKLLTEAAFSLNDAIIDQLPSSELCTHTFSAEFEKKMQKVIRRGNHPVLYRQLQRAAILVLVVLLSFTALMVVSPTARARVIAWIREQIAGYTAYSYFGETDSGRENVKYEFGYLPDGYKLQRVIQQNGIHIMIFENHATKELIYFSHTQDASAITYFVKDRSYTEQKIDIHSEDGLYLEANEDCMANEIIWFDSKEELFFLISAHLEKEDMIKIAENIKIYH